MIKIDSRFKLEVEEKGEVVVLEGTVRELTKSEKKEFDWLSDRVIDVQRLNFEAKAVEKQVRILEEKLPLQSGVDKLRTLELIESLNAELHNLSSSALKLAEDVNQEELVEKRLRKTVSGPNAEAILELGEKIGFDTLRAYIDKAVQQDYEKK